MNKKKGRLGRRGTGHEGQIVHNLETGRPDRAEGKGRKAEKAKQRVCRWFRFAQLAKGKESRP